jgi:pantoate--beta-alanine ligase
VLIFTKIKELQAFLAQIKLKNQTIGFVPTMGALHQGHLSLILASKQACDITICSIFVNPTQFNDKSDLDRYPKTPEKDIELLNSVFCNVLFMPSAEEMYPAKDERVFDFGYLDKILEGAHRPGHFNGVAVIVSKFFDLIKPNKAFFGSKDYQQAMIVKALNEKLKFNIDIVVCPTLRETDGLAMSSRNTLLNAKEREVAKIIPKLMSEVKPLKEQGHGIQEIKEYIVSELNKRGNYELDYFSICDAITLKELNSFSEAKHHIALIACYVGKIRLIDNLLLS